VLDVPAPAAAALVALAAVGAAASMALFDPAEHAVADAAARVRLAAARTEATRMSSPGKCLKRG
jgi:hypothetical protein